MTLHTTSRLCASEWNATLHSNHKQKRKCRNCSRFEISDRSADSFTRWLTTVHKRSYCELLESDKNTQRETNSVRVILQWGATIISRWFLWSGSTGSWGSGSGRRGPGRLLGHYGIELLTGLLGTHGESPVAQLPRANLHWNRWRSLPALQRPCEQLFTRTTWALFTLGEMSRVSRPRSRQVIGCAERTTVQSARPTTSVKVTIWFKSVYKDILVG